jgi:hypothetical protein
MLSEEIKRAKTREAVEIARRILTGEVGVIAGCRALTALSDSVVLDWAVDQDFVVFGAVESESDALPLEDQQNNWEGTAYDAKQLEVRRYESQVRDDVLKACRSLVDRFHGV